MEVKQCNNVKKYYSETEFGRKDNTEVNIMVVQHNMQAMNANRMLNVTTSTQAKSTEKLSSGYKINRAADDAAGLTISEKMRKQIKGLDQASTNAEDGVSSVQTAEGALTEVHSMLQRMNELAVQASNGTNSESDRSAIQDEISQLTTEIDRVSETTKFNETYLLKGSDGTKDHVLNAHDAGLKGTLSSVGEDATFTTDFTVGDKVTIGGKEYTIGETDKTKATGLIKAPATGTVDITIDGTTYKVDKDGKVSDANGNKLYVKTGDGQADAKEENTVKAATDFTTSDKFKDDNGANADNNELTVAGLQKIVGDHSVVSDGTTTVQLMKAGAKTPGVDEKDSSIISLAHARDLVKTELESANSIGSDKPVTVTNNNDGTFSWKLGKAEVANTLSFSLHVGADADMTNKINVDIDAMSSAGLGIKGLNVKDDSGKAATYAIDAIADAVSKVSAQRSALGAVQNRLEHTIANVDNVVENTTSAESRIRDTDMAEEMVNYSKNNILAQAGQSMLAQANQSNQGVLSLLQ